MTHDMTEQHTQRHTLRKRRVVTIRIRPELWREFLADVRQKGITTCLVLEGLMTAYLYGGKNVPGSKEPTVVNITIPHVVKRPRRLPKPERTPKKDRTNRYDPDRGWYFDPELDPGMVVVEQPREWAGEDKGFTWSEGARLWWKRE